MSDPTPQSQRLTAYARTFGEPDPEVTARLRERLREFVQLRELGRPRWVHWLQAAAFTTVVLVGATVWALHERDEPAASTAGQTIATDGSAQRIELHDGRAVTLAPLSAIRLVRDDADELTIELRRGEIELAGAADARPVRIDTGDHHVRLHGDAARVRHTGGVPLVVVREGTVLLLGPGLPDGGIRIAPLGTDSM